MLGELVDRGLAAQQGDLLVLTEPGVGLSDAIGPALFSDRVARLMRETELR